MAVEVSRGGFFTVVDTHSGKRPDISCRKTA